MSKVKIDIGSSIYNISTNRDPIYVEGLAKEINNKINSYISQNNTLTINNALILILLEYLDEYKTTKKSEDNLRDQINKYIEESEMLRKELSTLKLELKKFKLNNEKI